MSKIRHICGLSGGKDSTALALYLKDRIPEMEYVFTDTGCELQETLDYLDQVEAFLGQKVIRLNAEKGFDHWLKVFDNYLPSPQSRWCTNLLKLKPFEAYIGTDKVRSYVGLRYDERHRKGLISKKKNITSIHPFIEDKIDYDGVIQILEESGIGLPKYLEWGRSHSGCYFCFYQSKYEWVKLLHKYPDYFSAAEKYEKVDNGTGEGFTWLDDMPLRKIREKETQEIIIYEWEKRQERIAKNNKGSGLLVETLGGGVSINDEDHYCPLCHK